MATFDAAGKRVWGAVDQGHMDMGWVDRLGAGNVYNAEQQGVPYFYAYTTRPDGQRLRGGDTFAHSAPRGRPWGVGIGPLLTGSYYGDGYALGEHLRQGGIGDNEALFEFLWRDAKLEDKPREELPLSRYFGGPFGWMVARTGWDDQSVLAEMKVNVYNFANHQHLDAGAFQLYHKGALALDSGLYKGSSGAYGSPHCRNYYWRTIAHNSLLIHDPAEQFNPAAGYGNDGGQRLPNGRGEPRNLEVLTDPKNGYQTAEVLAHGFGPDAQAPDYTLLTGDLTRAYSDKVKQVVRSFVFLNLKNADVPGTLIVFDRVIASDPLFGKFWLLHTLEEPHVNGATAVVDRTEHGARGRLHLTALLPEPANCALGKVGGPGKEFWVFDQDVTNEVPADQVAKSSQEAGAWRIELSPKAPAAEDLFLTVMQTMDREPGTPLSVSRADAGTSVGCLLTGSAGNWLVLFPRDGGRGDGPVTFQTAGAATRVLVTGLAAGDWRAQGQGGRPQPVPVSAEAAAAWLTLPAGQWTLSKR
ncbi:MAG: hypothetical protein COZ06_12990 [Armatimonadetes bacterium CG_4_10_14_3_um_filter_66_18]|nr:hypothetical protein [Armatimonadota bacterium]NCO95302.1 hypothetical protein [Armatimonadota bacterium]NCP33861.1 hypothetical protein [Armatimonadota bacterium]PIW16918.1 MAG: hypothetical protein COW34_05500 [Armatimonadetes bacterium CG17_big_fil_post_rev_8_21_14_2_50_66_6]PIY49738.1 MAG: hypothetical protein COZ06_12990 [Armatimonadetes bacterium CG_4_10_14_3_um_filter_66_18]